MPKKIYSTPLSVVSMARQNHFDTRCKAQLQKSNLIATTDPFPIFGSAVLETPSSVPTYMAKLRAFVTFMLDNPQYDDSLILFYPYTPKGTVTCDEKATSHFLLSMFGTKGDPLRDMEVSYAANVYALLPLSAPLQAQMIRCFLLSLLPSFPHSLRTKKLLMLLATPLCARAAGPTPKTAKASIPL